MKILFLVPYPLSKSPSQRFRFEQYLPILEKSGYHAVIQPLFSSHYGNFILESGKTGVALRTLLTGLIRRWSILYSIRTFNYVFIHREAFPAGPPFFELLISKVFKKKIIYDFDDAIWLSDRPNEPRLFRALKWRSKAALICKWSYKVSCGNSYLAGYALRYNNRVVRNPTTIDTEHVHNPGLRRHQEARGTVTIGWTGTRSTLKYLALVEPVIRRLQAAYNHVDLVVIADEQPALTVDRLRFIPWRKATEIEDLQTIDIGIMPLPDDEWSKGKCGFKVLQYMALEIPSVASRIGVNSEIIDHNENGFLCVTDDEWYSSLQKLIESNALRKSFGTRGRELVRNRYSVQSNTGTFLSLFE